MFSMYWLVVEIPCYYRKRCTKKWASTFKQVTLSSDKKKLEMHAFIETLVFGPS